MALERTRAYLLSLPRVEETLQWDRLVYWVLDKAVGGKMFAMLQPEAGYPHALAFAATADGFHELLELEGVVPAPYLARAQWVAVETWDDLPERDLHRFLGVAYDRVEAKMPPRTRRILELKEREYRALVREKRAASVPDRRNGRASLPAKKRS